MVRHVNKKNITPRAMPCPAKGTKRRQRRRTMQGCSKPRAPRRSARNVRNRTVCSCTQRRTRKPTKRRVPRGMPYCSRTPRRAKRTVGKRIKQRARDSLKRRKGKRTTRRAPRRTTRRVPKQPVVNLHPTTRSMTRGFINLQALVRDRNPKVRNDTAMAKKLWARLTTRQMDILRNETKSPSSISFVDFSLEDSTSF